MSRKTKVKRTPPRVPIRKSAPRKGSQDEIDERRREVVRLRMMGMGYRSIAQKLNVGHMTIKRDLEAIREETGKRMSQFERDYHIASTVSVYEQVEEEAWKEFNSAGPGSAQRARFLDVVRGARNDQVKLLADLGLLRRAPQEIQHTVTSKVVDQWSPQAQDLVALAIIKASLSPAAEPVREVIDIPSPMAALPAKKGNGTKKVSMAEFDEDDEDEEHAA